MQAENRAVFEVRQYGAEGSGEGLETNAFQAAIDACAEKGGVVRVGPGRYVIGTIRLRSNVELHLEEGAEILGSTSLDDYATDIQGAIEAPEFDKCLLYAENARNISLTGRGTLNGRGRRDNFPTGKRGAKCDRPMLIRFVRCTDLTFTDLTLRDSASWCTHLVECEDLTIRRITLDSHVNVNNDGFDLDGCANVLVEDCDLRTGDDAVCPKSTTLKPCENIVVRNCRISSNTAAFKCGTSSRGGFRNLSFSNCEITDCPMGVIKLLVVDGGVLENVTLSNLTMRNVGGPFFLRLGNRGRLYQAPTTQVQHKDAAHEGAPVGSFRNVVIENVVAEVGGTQHDRMGLMLTGIPGHRLEGVTFRNVRVTFPGGGPAEAVSREVPEDVTRYPEQFFFGVLPAWGLFARHVNGLVFDNVQIDSDNPDPRPPVVLEDVHNYEVSGLQINGGTEFACVPA